MKSLIGYSALLVSVFIMLGGCAKSGSNNSLNLSSLSVSDPHILSSSVVTIPAASCNAPDVQRAIDLASEGNTVTIPAGTCTWTSGVTISGKGINVKGAGSARIIAKDNGTDEHTITTGALTVNISYYSPGFSGSSISIGQTLLVFEVGADLNFMQGTVTSFDSATGALKMNITSIGGSGTAHRWLIATAPTSENETIIINSPPSSAQTNLFTITEDTSFHTSVSNIHIETGAVQQQMFILEYSSGGQAILLHDMWLQGNANLPAPPNSDRTMIEGDTNRGVVWNVSFDSSPFNISTMAAVVVKDASNKTGSWSQPSLWGAADTTGQGNFYVESSDFHAMGCTSDTDDNGRMVARYNLYDNAAIGTHGADSGYYGQRYLDIYNNTFAFNGYSDKTTFAVPWWFFVRGGTFAFHNNTIPNLVSQDYGTKSNINMIVMNLQRNSGPLPCWGAGTSGGKDYYVPHQVGIGYVTGKGVDGMGLSTYQSDVFGGPPPPEYVGDSEPAYIWGNNNSTVALANVAVSDYGLTTTGISCPTSAGQTYDSSVNYIKLNRDYFNGTAKPGYTPYTYPHPLTLGQSSTGSSPTPTPVPTATPAPTATPKASPTSTPKASPTPTPTPSPSRSPASTSWTLCGQEYGTCSFSGTKVVAYGAGTSFYFKTLSNGTACNNGVLGNPDVNVNKACYIVDLPAPNWTLCGQEYGTCSFSGTKVVAYGAGSSFYYKTVSNGTACNNNVLGNPDVNVVKTCYLLPLP